MVSNPDLKAIAARGLLNGSTPNGITGQADKANEALNGAHIDEHIKNELRHWLTEVGDKAGKLTTDERNLVGDIVTDMCHGLDAVRDSKHIRKVGSWGTARVVKANPQLYSFATEASKRWAEIGWGGIDGGGPGVMEAARTPFLEAEQKLSFPVSLKLPFEPRRPELAELPTYSECKYFSPRKFLMVRSASVLVIYPGGFGTMDELYEALTLVQTGKGKPTPIILADPGNRGFWHHMLEHTKMQIAEGYVSEGDLERISVASTVDEIFDQAAAHYRNFQQRHILPSQKADVDPMVIDVMAPVTMGDLAKLNNKFGALLAEGTRFTRLTPAAARSGSQALDRIGFHLKASASNMVPFIATTTNELERVGETHRSLGVTSSSDLLKTVSTTDWAEISSDARRIHASHNSSKWAARPPIRDGSLATQLDIVPANPAGIDFGSPSIGLERPLN